MNNYKITVLRGDGIGPEIVNECTKVLDKAGEKFGFKFDTTISFWADAQLTQQACLIQKKLQRRAKRRTQCFWAQ